jgi:hypothetical protein
MPARHIHQDRPVDALRQQAYCALTKSPGARAYHDQLRRRGDGHNAALRKLVNRLVGITHGRLKTGTLYDETIAWSHRSPPPHTRRCLTRTTMGCLNSVNTVRVPPHPVHP